MALVTEGQVVKPYGFTKGFERAVATMLCASAQFYARVGTGITAEALATEEAQQAVLAVQEIARETGTGPGSCLLVVQRLRRWANSGKVTFELVTRVSDMFDTALDAGLPPLESTVTELTPVLQQRIRDRAVRSAIEAYGKGEALTDAMQLEEEAQRVGKGDGDLGLLLGEETLRELQALARVERLPTGVLELDAEIGGLPRGGLGFFLGAPGDGKSMGLSQVAAVSMLTGALTVYASLELPRSIVNARVVAAATNIAINELTSNEDLARERMMALKQAGAAGFVSQYFSPQTTTVRDLASWVDRIEQQYGRKVDTVVVDYADKLGAPLRPGQREQSEYTVQRDVYEGLRHYGVETERFMWTASQATRQKDKRKRLDLNDTADSMHKGRVADLVVTINLEDEATMVSLYTAKNRHGKSRFAVGPMPLDWAFGRLTALEMPVMWTPAGRTIQLLNGGQKTQAGGPNNGGW